MANDELPDGWASVPIKELVELNPKANHADDLEVGFVPMPLMGTRFGAQVRFEVRPWGEVKKGYTHFQDGDVLLAKITPCFENGKGGLIHGLPNGVGAGSTEYFVCRPHEGRLVPEYLLGFLKTPVFMSEGATQMTGSVGHKRVPKDFLLDSQLPLAPFAEQKRIAEKLEAVLGRVDACRARLDRVPALLKRFRQSVLAAATSGQLTEDWREENGGEEWRKKKLTELGELGRGKSKHRPRNDPRLYGGPYPFIQTGDVANSGGWIKKHSQTYSELGLAQSRLWPAGTVCITIAANIADTAILSYEACFPDSVVGFVANPKECRPEFIKWTVDVIKDDLEAYAPATAQKNINLGVLYEVDLSIPPLPEQQEIVRRVEILFAFADRIEARLSSAQKTVERLTPAVLAKAFRGHLVPQDPTDEPASVLFERVRAEQLAKAAKPKSKEPTNKPAMKQLSKDSVKQAILALPKDSFTFADLRAVAPGEYHTLTDIVFELLSENRAPLKQVFNEKSQQMQFHRIKS